MSVKLGLLLEGVS